MVAARSEKKRPAHVGRRRRGPDARALGLKTAQTAQAQERNALLDNLAGDPLPEGCFRHRVVFRGHWGALRAAPS